MFQTKVVEKLRTRILYSVCFIINPAVYEIMWKNIIERGRPQMKIWRMRITRWIIKATDTHSEYVILIAFLLKQWLDERASILSFTYTGCPRRNGQNFRRVFLMLNYTDMTQNTYIQS